MTANEVSARPVSPALTLLAVSPYGRDDAGNSLPFAALDHDEFWPNQPKLMTVI
jgi:hypothetical protein